jgi:hypothetical protein
VRWCAAAKEELEAVLIVCLSFFGVGEDFVGLRDFCSTQNLLVGSSDEKIDWLGVDWEG